MGTDEEYLDSLLRSVTADLTNEEQKIEDDNISEDEMLSINDLFETQESFFAENEDGEPEEVSIEDFILGNDTTEREIADGDTALDIDAMLKELNLLDDDMNVQGVETEIEESTDIGTEPFFASDIDNEVDEINQLLEKADNNEAISDDIFSLFTTPDDIEMREEEPFDLMAEINNQENMPVVVDKKAEKERKRKEKAAAKEAAKEAKKIAKAQKKSQKVKETVDASETLEELEFVESEEESENVTLKNTQQFTVSEENDFGNFQEVEGFDDIESLLSSFNMEELQIQATPVETKETFSEPDNILSMDNLKFDDDVESGTDKIQEKPKDGGEEKKTGWFKRFIDFLMEEDEEDEADENGGKKKENSVQTVDVEMGDSAIINELEKRGKKATKNKKSNPKKMALDDDEAEGKKATKGKKIKKKKAPETGMAKRYKLVDPEEKKIGKAGGIAIVLLAASVFAVVFLINIVFTPILAKYRAEKAFKEQDYKTCYQEFYGWELNEKEQNMVDVSRVVLKMERRLEAYEQYKGLRQKIEALDSLMRAVQNYDEIYQEALNCGAEGEVEVRYNVIISILAEEYGLSEKDAKAIADVKSDIEYTRYLDAIIKGEIDAKPENGNQEEIPGLLPEEEELPDSKFSD